MRALFVFCVLFGAASAGSRDLDAYSSYPILQEYERLCASGQVPESGSLVRLEGEETWVYCKKSRNNKVIEKEERKTFSVDTVPQAVFIKPGDVQLKQRVTVVGNVKSGKTRIYYVPPNVGSDVDVSVHANTERPVKPAVFFLSKNDEKSDKWSFGRRGGSRDH